MLATLVACFKMGGGNFIFVYFTLSPQQDIHECAQACQMLSTCYEFYLFRHYIESKTPSWRRRKDTPTECTNNLCPFSIQRATIDKIPFVRGEHLLKRHLPTTLNRTKKSFAPLSTARIVVNGTFLRGNVAFKEEVCHVYGCHGWCDVPIADVLSVTRQFISTRNNHGGSSRGQKPLPITGQGWWRSVFE